jgi:hypothetical protein
MTTEIKNYGLILDKPIVGKDYIYGGYSKLPLEQLQPNKNWMDYLPIRELQNYGLVEPYACVTFTIFNCVEILIKKKYGIEINFSDRFLSCVSGTKDLHGNSPQTVCEFLRKIGVVPEELWPFNDTIKSFDEYYAPIPPKLYELARDFNEKWDFKYEFVPNDSYSISQALTMSPLLISWTAWFEKDGLYYKPEGMTDNHATTLFQERKNEFWRVFDTYTPVIKDLDYKDAPAQIMRFWIESKEPLSACPAPKKTVWQKIVEWIASIFT